LGKGSIRIRAFVNNTLHPECWGKVSCPFKQKFQGQMYRLHTVVERSISNCTLVAKKSSWKIFNTRCIRSSRPDRDYAIFPPQIVSFRIGWWVSNTVSRGRTLRCGVRYTRKKLPLGLPRGGLERDSWDTNSFKTQNLDWPFLRRIRGVVIEIDPSPWWCEGP